MPKVRTSIFRPPLQIKLYLNMVRFRANADEEIDMKTILKILLIIILSAITIVAGTDPQAMVSECAQIKSTGITIPDLERWGGNFVLGAGIVIVGVSAFVDSAFSIFGGTPLDTDAFDNAGYGVPLMEGAVGAVLCISGAITILSKTCS